MRQPFWFSVYTCSKPWAQPQSAGTGEHAVVACSVVDVVVDTGVVVVVVEGLVVVMATQVQRLQPFSRVMMVGVAPSLQTQLVTGAHVVWA